MLKFSVKYYFKCVALSLLFYVFGGFILSFFLTEEESVFSLVVPVILCIIGVFLRILVLKHQLQKECIADFETADYFKMSIPAVCLLIFIALFLLCDICVHHMGEWLQQSAFDSIKFYLFVLFPGALTVDGVLYNISYWSNTVYYALLIANILIYIVPTLLYIKMKSSRDHREDFT